MPTNSKKHVAKPWQPDIPAPTGEQTTSGFVYNPYTRRVHYAWSSQCFHGIGYASQKEQRKAGCSAAHGSIAMYSTEVLAWQALKREIKKDCAKVCQEIDRKIASVSTLAITKTDQQIVDETENLAREIARQHGRLVSHDVLLRHSKHPRARMYWTLACAAQEMLCKTDVSNALVNIDDDDEPKE